MTREELLAVLWENEDARVSGAELARRFGVSRTAVWQMIGQLQAEGYEIEAAPRRGYRLRPESDVLSAEGVRRFLRRQGLSLHYYKTIGSTNTTLKGFASQGAPAGLVLLADSQSAGRGRMGRDFYSPASSGLYMSLLLRPALPAAEAVKLTACAAVAVAETIEELSGREAGIKWVNDIFIDGRKVCGILTEASLDCESGMLHYAVVGLGINTRVPAGDFPAGLRGVAGAAFGAESVPALRCRLAAGILDRLCDYAENPGDPAVFEAYKRRCLVLGKPVNVLYPDKEPVPAEVVGLREDYALLLRRPDGSVAPLSSGEVSVRVKD